MGKLVRNLPYIIIIALSCDRFGGLILFKEVDMWLKKEIPESKDLGISISVAGFPERKKNIGERIGKITGEVKKIVPENAIISTEVILLPPPGKLF